MSTENIIDTSTEEGRKLVQEENTEAGTGVEDRVDAGSRDDALPDVQYTAEPEQRKPEPVRMSPGDAARAEMAKRFRRSDQVPYNGNPNDPEMLYGDVAREVLTPEPVDEDIIGSRPEAAEPKPVDEPRRFKIKIRGQEVELTEEEVLRRAAQVTAADSYLDEAKDLLREAKGIKAERAGRDRQHPDEQSSTQDDGLEIDPPQDQRHPVDTKSVVEKIQYGDPEEAAQELEELIDRKAGEKSSQTQLKRIMDNDLAKSQKALNAFRAENPELDKDELSSRAIEQIVYDIYREEISSLGQVDADKIPKNPVELANWHRFYRVNGHQVSDAKAVLDAAKTRFEAWRGKPATPPQPRKAQGRIEVNVDRTERRAAIPNQPTRAVAPRPAPQAQAGASRSSVIAKMRAARGQVIA